MCNPLFVQTSKGWINLAQVTQITKRGGTMDFIFVTGGHERDIDYVELPQKEGERIMQRLIGSEYLLPEG
jgi:hypothetical protein